MEDIAISRLLCWQWKDAAQNIIYLYFKIELWHLYKSLLPLRRAYLFTFMLSHHPLIKKHQLESTDVICIRYYWFIFSMTVTGSLLPLITMFSQSLIFKGALYLCFVVSERASDIPSCYIILWLFWESVVIRDLLLLLASWLCHWYE